MSTFKHDPLVCIDPGTVESAYVCYDPTTHTVGDMAILPNARLVDRLAYARNWPPGSILVIEEFERMGMDVGKSVFQTVRWTGRFEQAFGDYLTHFIPRRRIKMQLCNTMRAKDKNIRAALLDMFEPTGGGKTPAVGTAKKPGPLFGMKSHLWSALAVGVAWSQIKEEEARAEAAS